MYHHRIYHCINKEPLSPKIVVPGTLSQDVESIVTAEREYFMECLKIKLQKGLQQLDFLFLWYIAKCQIGHCRGQHLCNKSID